MSQDGPPKICWRGESGQRAIRCFLRRTQASPEFGHISGLVLRRRRVSRSWMPQATVVLRLAALRRRRAPRLPRTSGQRAIRCFLRRTQASPEFGHISGLVLRRRRVSRSWMPQATVVLRLAALSRRTSAAPTAHLRQPDRHPNPNPNPIAQKLPQTAVPVPQHNTAPATAMTPHRHYQRHPASAHGT